MNQFPIARATLALCLAASPVAAADPITYPVASGVVTVVCPMTIGGSFEVKTTALAGELTPDTDKPGALAGEIRVDLATLDAGISLRSRHLKENYLEVGKGEGFTAAVLSEVSLEVPDIPSFRGKAPFRGTFLLHGQKQEVRGSAQVRGGEGRLTVEAEFPVRVSSHAIPKPSYLGVGVKDEVKVKVELEVTPVVKVGGRS